jgi:hypothetical protein
MLGKCENDSFKGGVLNKCSFQYKYCNFFVFVMK